MAVNTVAMGFIIHPLSIVDIAISVDESAFSVGLVVFPPSFIHRAIWPYLAAFTLADVLALDPLSIVLGVVLQLDHSAILDQVFSVVGLLVIVELSELFSNLLHLGVVIVISDLGIWIVLVNAHIHLGHPYFLPGQVASDCCLHLYDEGKLLHCDPSA